MRLNENEAIPILGIYLPFMENARTCQLFCYREGHFLTLYRDPLARLDLTPKILNYIATIVSSGFQNIEISIF